MERRGELRGRWKAIWSEKRVNRDGTHCAMASCRMPRGFDVLLTTDKNIRYQQNLSERRIAIVVLGKGRWRLIRSVLHQIVAAVEAATPGSYTEVDIPG